ncbi:hypothetical protein HC891_09445 [Candidatus Gracilibacteria bacterium]|nr:hypothetical protein [Candidatus Gracilibacteria bacterium]
MGRSARIELTIDERLIAPADQIDTVRIGHTLLAEKERPTETKAIEVEQVIQNCLPVDNAIGAHQRIREVVREVTLV